MRLGVKEMGEKTKTQRPKKRKVGAPGEGPPVRTRRKAGGPPVNEADNNVSVDNAEDMEGANREELAALETLLFGAPTMTKAETEAEEGGPPGAPTDAEAAEGRKKRKRKVDNKNSSSSGGEGPVAAAAKDAADPAEAATAATAATEAASSGAAWVDPDDARLRVDIETNPKLRKLKIKKEEKYISGAEYEKRLKKLHSKITGNAENLDWIEEARKRKKEAEAELEESVAPIVSHRV